jgi:hypothetical protein
MLFAVRLYVGWRAHWYVAVWPLWSVCVMKLPRSISFIININSARGCGGERFSEEPLVSSSTAAVLREKLLLELFSTDVNNNYFEMLNGTSS